MKWPLAFLMMLLLCISPVQAEEDFYFDYKSKEFEEVASQFYCNCGCGQDHFECDANTCGNTKVFKRELADLMNMGWDKDKIREHYVKMHGESILMAPQKKGFSLTAWIIPFAAIILGGGIIYVAIRRWVKQNQVEVQKGEADGSITSDETENEITKSIIDEERKKYL